MEHIKIIGGQRLIGNIKIGGAKNATLPLMAASLLTDQVMTYENIPYLMSDTQTKQLLLEQLGAECNVDEKRQELKVHAHTIKSIEASYEIVSKMRASFLVLGPLLARMGEAKVSLPGGCAIGARPVDLHLEALRALGANIELENGYIHATAPQGLKGADYTFPLVTVTGTKNLLMAATLAKGTTRIGNAAREPEVANLIDCLTKMGARIQGVGTGTLIVEGVTSLNGTTHRIISDRIEAGSYAIAAAITQGDLTLEGVMLHEILPTFLDTLRRMGITIEEHKNYLRVKSDGVFQGNDIMTEPFPGIPTDLQAQFMALASVAEGASMITENIWENRFMHVSELTRFGANITVHGRSALVRGIKKLQGAPVMATDLRASFSLILAGLAAEGETIINSIHHLDRGYERLEAKLSACGAQISRV